MAKQTPSSKTKVQQEVETFMNLRKDKGFDAALKYLDGLPKRRREEVAEKAMMLIAAERSIGKPRN